MRDCPKSRCGRGCWGMELGEKLEGRAAETTFLSSMVEPGDHQRHHSRVELTVNTSTLRFASRFLMNLN